MRFAGDGGVLTYGETEDVLLEVASYKPNDLRGHRVQMGEGLKYVVCLGRVTHFGVVLGRKHRARCTHVSCCTMNLPLHACLWCHLFGALLLRNRSFLVNFRSKCVVRRTSYKSAGGSLARRGEDLLAVLPMRQELDDFAPSGWQRLLYTVAWRGNDIVVRRCITIWEEVCGKGRVHEVVEVVDAPARHCRR
jgi:hypothetical protein